MPDRNEPRPQDETTREPLSESERAPEHREHELTEPTSSSPVTPPERTEDFQPRIWSVLAHLAVFVLPVIAPLLILALQEQILGENSAFVDHHTKQATVWQIATLVIGLVTFGIGALVMAIFSILAALAAYRSEWYEYPFIGAQASRAF